MRDCRVRVSVVLHVFVVVNFKFRLDFLFVFLMLSQGAIRDIKLVPSGRVGLSVSDDGTVSWFGYGVWGSGES